MKITYDAYLGIAGYIALEIELDYKFSVPGTMYAPNGDPGDPPESAEIEINSITRNGVDMMWLHDPLMNDDDFWACASNQACCDLESDRADYYYDQERDRRLELHGDTKDAAGFFQGELFV